MTDLLEPAQRARARCRACGKKIDKGELRFGEHLPNPFGEGDATYWFHLVCAACTRSEKLLPLLSSSEIDVPDKARFLRLAAAGVAHPRATRLLRAERSPSGRARCRSCRQLIETGAWRLALGIFEEGRMEPIGFIHVECSAAYFETRDVLDRIAVLTPDLDHGREEIAALLAAEPRPPAEPALASAKSETPAEPEPAKRSG